jgi:hypothetical protein
MFTKILTAIGVMFLGFLASWLVANAAVGMKAPDMMPALPSGYSSLN